MDSTSTSTPRPHLPSQISGPLFGGDYNPEQWTAAMGYADEQIWLEDLRMMRQAGVNIVSVGIFSWAQIQPSEQTFTYEWLDRLLDLLAEHGIGACLATGTAAQPAWMSLAYPEILPVNAAGQRHRHGERMNFCPSSPTFRRLAQQLVRATAERYRAHSALKMWHVSNEYGPVCYCDTCAARFRSWLQQRYGSLEAVNLHWVAPFWGHSFSDWSQIEPPSALGNRSLPGMVLDYQRFMSDMNLECFEAEASILRELAPEVPVTTNFHGLVKWLDYASWAPRQDIIAWDSYPAYGEPPEHVAFRFDLMRGLKQGQPWLLMEQTPSQTQWRPFNPLWRPGALRLHSYQALAHGSEGAMFFQWRQSRGGAEMHHGAIVAHAGYTETRVFREVSALGAELGQLGTQLLGTRSPARVALLFSWPNWWAVEFQPGLSANLKYLDEVMRYYSALWQQHVAVDIISPDQPLDGYDLVVAPLLYMLSEAQGAALERYVAAGGALLCTYFSGVVAEDARAWLGGYPGPLRAALGIWVEEADPLPPDARNSIEVPAGSGIQPGSYSCDQWCEVLHLEGARALATFGADFYAGQPALTQHDFGEGHAYYLATRPEPQLLAQLFGSLLRDLGIRPALDLPAGVELTERQDGERRFLFVLNHSADACPIALPAPMRDLLTGQLHERQLELAPRAVAILVAEPIAG